MNGKDGDVFFSERGLRQENLLSPYLFLFRGKGLSSMISSYERDNEIKGVKICGVAPTVSHLLFAMTV